MTKHLLHLKFFERGTVVRPQVATFSGECVTPNDITTDDWHQTKPAEDAINNNIKEIEREIDLMRTLGQVKPFVEGEPIGAYKRVKLRKPTAAEIKRYHKQRQEWARKEMLELRAKNDAALTSLLARI